MSANARSQQRTCPMVYLLRSIERGGSGGRGAHGGQNERAGASVKTSAISPETPATDARKPSRTVCTGPAETAALSASAIATPRISGDEAD